MKIGPLKSTSIGPHFITSEYFFNSGQVVFILKLNCKKKNRVGICFNVHPFSLTPKKIKTPVFMLRWAL